jgi:hypothetical protein
MRILLVSSTYFPPQVGGISRAMEALAAHLDPAHVTCVTRLVAEWLARFFPVQKPRG